MFRRNELVDAWLHQASVDMQAANLLLSSSDLNLCGVVCYHSQQAAEKALKGLLAAAELDIEKTHDLVRLLDLCANTGISVDLIMPAATLLTPFATQFRYPGMGENPSLSQSQEAIVAAEITLSWVLELLPSKEPSSF
jgi:HEPN domain-containing protein